MTLRFELFVEDVARSVDFYTQIMGFKVIKANDTYHSLNRDGVTIGIGQARHLAENHYFRPEITTQRKGLGVEIVFEVDNVEAFYHEIQASGYLIAEELTRRKHGLTDFRLVDPDGYYLRPTSRD